MLYKGSINTYTAGRLLGKGGEGIVYEIEESNDHVLKIYNEAISGQKARKLQLMASINEPQLQSYAAWPIDVVTDKTGSICGFIMRKLSGYVPMHMLFSPLDRKKLFPDKGYNFLVHVARNLAMAFAQLHAKGIIIGDVNEGNLLVNTQGMVGMIDCDSFQLKDEKNFYYCEVGVPRYTAPELYDSGSFATTIRTESSDVFAMAILIFQLLLLGRHPFAGKNLSHEDISEEKAIRNYMFAYSLNRSSHNFLAPPPDALPITILGGTLVQYFQQSFESRNRIPVLQWIHALEQLLTTMKSCSKSKIHSYPAGLEYCPWCEIKEKRNILYFLDEQLLQSADWSKDIDSFVNGIKIEKLHFPPLDNPPFLDVQANPINENYGSYKQYQILTILLISAIALIICISYGVSIMFAVFLVGIISQLLPWKKELKKEKERYAEAVKNTTSALDTALDEYHNPVYAPSYNNACTTLREKIHQFKKLPSHLRSEKQRIEETLYNSQLDTFLQGFLLEQHTIPGIAAKRKQLLYQANIYNAADISKLQNRSIQGIGPKYTQDLLSWQRQISADFVYKPDSSMLTREYNRIQKQFEEEKRKLSVAIKGTYSQTLQLKAGITTRQKQLAVEIQSLYFNVAQAEADQQAFNALTNSY